MRPFRFSNKTKQIADGYFGAAKSAALDGPNPRFNWPQPPSQTILRMSTAWYGGQLKVSLRSLENRLPRVCPVTHDSHHLPAIPAQFVRPRKHFVIACGSHNLIIPLLARGGLRGGTVANRRGQTVVRALESARLDLYLTRSIAVVVIGVVSGRIAQAAPKSCSRKLNLPLTSRGSNPRCSCQPGVSGSDEVGAATMPAIAMCYRNARTQQRETT